MDHENIQNQDVNLVLSRDAKPRLKWTQELHQRFIEAVARLGGPEKATPKSLMRVMGIHGLTLYHLKSHLQKYRLGKIQQSPACSGSMQEDFINDHRSDITSIDYNDENPNQINESANIAQALQLMQMEVQKQLHEQTEVQRRLQLRIEAQGKYLQSVLRKAQDTLSGFNSSSIEVEVAKTELSHLLTELNNSTLKQNLEKIPRTKSSLQSSLTSSESYGGHRNDQRILPLMEMKPAEKRGRERCGSTVSDGNCGKRLEKGSNKFDLNSEYVEFDFDFDF